MGDPIPGPELLGFLATCRPGCVWCRLSPTLCALRRGHLFSSAARAVLDQTEEMLNVITADHHVEARDTANALAQRIEDILAN